MALKGGNSKIAQLLLELELNSGIQASVKDRQTSFKYALWNSNTDVLEQLLKAYPECFSSLFLNEINHPLHYAAKNNSIQLASLLLEAGMKVNKKNDKGRTPLHVAANSCHHEMIDYLLASGAKPEIEDHQVLTALDYIKLAFIYVKQLTKDQRH